jgi:diaminohydroxyphosphoribosylaminopyrimidine deaminase / 5-amino-6-(5-phosphoribosylamino)uracil reductase
VKVGTIHESSLQNVLKELYKRDIQSVLVEGGAKLLNSFIKNGLWDEARVFSSDAVIGSGVKAPDFDGLPVSKIKVGADTLNQYIRDKVY